MDFPEIRAILKHHDWLAAKELGQNFLVQADLVRKMAALAKEHEVALEIGPGLGSLTSALLEKAASVIAFEIDPRMVAVLREAAVGDHLTLIQSDVRLINLADYAIPNAQQVLYGNLPYYITTELCEQILIQAAERLRMVVLLLQKEAGERLFSKANCKSFGPLAVLSANLGGFRQVFKVPPSAFYPQPHVQSAVYVAEMHCPEVLRSACQRAAYYAFLELLFAHRRKTLAALVKLHRQQGTVIPQKPEQKIAREALEHLDELLAWGQYASLRAEQIEPEAWLSLWEQIMLIQEEASGWIN